VKVTVCEWPNRADFYEEAWGELTEHVRAEGSELVLLPEIPFAPWIAARRPFDQEVWREAVSSHERWRARFSDLGPVRICGTAPVGYGPRRLNRAFLWDALDGYREAHAKYYLPNEEGSWERTWFERGAGRFDPVQSRGLTLGFLICTDLWFFQHSRAYGKAGAELLLCPRATRRGTLKTWELGYRTAALVSGAFCLSSNRISGEDERVDLGGRGWIIDPGGEILTRTTPLDPIRTVDIDLREARRAKSTYPRYVLE
jgi:N-carbamoylputrescine amidase